MANSHTDSHTVIFYSYMKMQQAASSGSGGVGWYRGTSIIRTPPLFKDQHRTLGIVLLQVSMGRRFLMSEVPLQWSVEETIVRKVDDCSGKICPLQNLPEMGWLPGGVP